MGPISLKDVTVVLPSFNEADAIAGVIERIRATVPEAAILVVDDGSSDNTSEVAREAGAIVVGHDENTGNGAAVKTGLRSAETEFVLLMDADGQHPPESINELLKVLETHDMVVGARDVVAHSAFRHFGNTVLNIFASWVTGRRITDLTSGFRAARRSVILNYIHLFPDGFSYPTTSTIALLKGGYRVKFLPIAGMVPRKTGISKIRPFRDGLKFMTIIAKLTILFNPMKVLLPIGGFFFCSGAGIIVYHFNIGKQGIEQAPMLLMIFGVAIIIMGFLADLLASVSTRK